MIKLAQAKIERFAKSLLFEGLKQEICRLWIHNCQFIQESRGFLVTYETSDEKKHE
jgi:hypothetical protein